MVSWRTLLLTVLLASWCSVADAHPHHHAVEEPGVYSGLLHPFTGLDHLLAMVATGLLAAQLGGKALWAIPGSFVGSMIVGGFFGMSGTAMPGVEFGIAMSIVLLGAALAVNKKQPLALPMIAVAIFGFVHGLAHGTEIPSLMNPAIYTLGFVVATIALHAIGVVIGRIAVASKNGQTALRLSGAAIAVAGLFVLVQ